MTLEEEVVRLKAISLNVRTISLVMKHPGYSRRA